MASFPCTSADISPAFLSEVLKAKISACSSKPIGAGLVGDSARISIEYAEGHSGPATIAGKFPAADATSRSTAASMQLYEKEVGFYREIAPHVAIRTPELHYAAYDSDSGDFLLLMEDCGPAEQGDQLTSCSLEQAHAAMEQLAALHGPSFRNQNLLKLGFLKPVEQVRAFAAAGYPGASDKFAAFYDHKIDRAILTYIGKLGAMSSQLFLQEPPTGPCVVHGDFRLDNILFDICNGEEAMATLDWQTVTLGDPLTDLGYFMGAGIGSALRRPHERDLLEHYRMALIENGGPDLGNIRNEDGYARGALHGISTAVFSAAFVEHNDRSEAIFRSMAVGAAELAMELDALQALEG